jgi:spermidine synthase
MAQHWHSLEIVETSDGPLELRQHGNDEFLILLSNRVLMNSRQNRSELAVAERPCRTLADHAAPRVLIGGLGMGCTLRAALDTLPKTAVVQVAELNPIIERWCRGPLADVSGQALDEPRVELEIADVSKVIARHAAADQVSFDAIILDLYEGPHAHTDVKRDPFFSRTALQRTQQALHPGGTFAVWSEAPDEAFEARIKKAGFKLTRTRPGKGGLRHAVYLAVKR